MAKLPTWDDVKRAADELERQVQSAGASARAKWQQVKPKLVELSKTVEAKGQKAGDAIQTQVSALSDALLKLQQEIANDLKIGRKPQDPEKPPGE